MAGDKPMTKTTNFEALETINTALGEIYHCVTVGPEWFTNGRQGQMAQASMWEQRAREALKHLMRNKSQRLIKKLREAEWEKRHAKFR